MTIAQADRQERYVEAAVAAELDELANTSAGRNHALNKAAHALGTFVGAELLGYDEAVTRLEAACESNGYLSKDGRPAVRNTINSGLRAGMKEPRQLLPAVETSLRAVRSAQITKAANTQVASLTVAEFAAAKKLPVGALAFYGVVDSEYMGCACVKIPYKRRDGSEARARARCALTGSRSQRWDGKEGEVVAYEPDLGELARAQRYVVVVEGESDTLTLLYAGFPALGVPGADLVKTVLTAEHIAGIDRVFISCEVNEAGEPDSGAERFIPNVRSRLEALGFEGAVYELRMPDRAKDPSDLWLRDPGSFPSRLRAAMDEAATPPRPAYQTLSEMVERSLRPVGQRLQTRFATLDEATRGGIPLGRVVVLAGAPGAGKSGLSVFLADAWERAGCAVVYLASDEPAEGIVMRLGQLAGFSREGLESEGPAGESIRHGFAREVAGRAIAVIEPDADESMRSIEDAERALMHLAGERPRVLVVDSLQTAFCAGAALAESARDRIDAKLAVIKAIAKRGTLVVAISEMSRAGYRSGARTENISALAAGKESGSIEYGASLLIGLRSVAGENGKVDVEVAKNRLGGSKPEFRLQLDFERASFEEIGLPEADDEVGSKQARFSRLRTAILEAVRVQSLTSATAIYRAVKGTKSEVLAEVKELLTEGTLVTVNGVFRVAEIGGVNGPRN